MLYPLKFIPRFKETIWGNNKLQQLFRKQIQSDKTGESWEISGVENAVSIVDNGTFSGWSLQQLINEFKGELLGYKIYEKYAKTFPLLFKLIDANDNLSIQVHPNDAVAQTRHNSFGKTEMWYIIEAGPGAEIIAGFTKNSSPQEYMEAIKNGNIEKLFQKIPVKKGDVFYIPAGLVHAIGKGIVLAEIQQASDVTYRIYDFNRKDANGSQRALHTQQAIDVIDYKIPEKIKIPYKTEKNKLNEVVRSPFFTTGILFFDDEIKRSYRAIDSFVVYMCMEGQFFIRYGNNKMLIVEKGDTILIPAALKNITLQPVVESYLLEIHL